MEVSKLIEIDRLIQTTSPVEQEINLFEEFIKPHVYYNLVYEKENRMPLQEDYCSETDKGFLMERYGLYNGVVNDATALANYINQHSGKKEHTLKINSPLCRYINIVVDDTLGCGATCNASQEDLVNGKHNVVYLRLNPSVIGQNVLRNLLVHELTHAWQDLNLRKKCLSLSQEIQKTGYNKLGGNMSAPKSSLKYKVAHIQYFFNWIERGAYVASLSSFLLDSYNGNYLTTNTLMDVLKQTRVCQIYNECFGYFEDFNELDDDGKNEVVSLFNEMSSYNFKTYGELRRWLKVKMNQVNRHIVKVVNQIAKDKLNIGGMVSLFPFDATP